MQAAGRDASAADFVGFESLESRLLLTAVPVVDLPTLMPGGGGNGAVGITLFGIDAFDFAGLSVSGAGDVNNDGFDDIIIGAMQAAGAANGEPGAGESYVVFGRASFIGTPTIELSSLNGTDGFTLFGVDRNDLSGRSVAGAGDVNGDGFDDLIVGGYHGNAGNSRYQAGESYIVFGKSSFAATPTIDLATLNGTNGVALFGVDAQDDSGRSVAAAGDVNGDNFDDLIVGAPRADGPANNEIYAGESYVIFGKADFTGISSIELSSLNGVTGFRLVGVDSFDRAGRSVAGAGDVNGDGFDDLIVGAYQADSPVPFRSDAGEIYVVFGKASFAATPTIDLSTLDGTNGFTLYGAGEGDQSGRSVAGAGDVNNDGFADIIIGARGADGIAESRSGAGDSFVVFGKDDFSATPSIDLAQLNGVNGFTIHGTDENDQSGQQVSGAGDVNGDGFDDEIIGAPYADGPGNTRNAAGDSFVVFGKSSFAATPVLELRLLNGTNGFTIYGTDNGDYTGSSVSGAGDVNGDGFADVIVGARGAEQSVNPKESAGEAYVIFGRETTWPEVNVLGNGVHITESRGPRGE